MTRSLLQEACAMLCGYVSSCEKQVRIVEVQLCCQTLFKPGDSDNIRYMLKKCLNIITQR
jgi:hypothetical protein